MVKVRDVVGGHGGKLEGWNMSRCWRMRDPLAEG